MRSEVKARTETTGMLLAAVLVAVPVAKSAAQTNGGQDRPNILFAIADDWSWPHAGAYGDRVVRTPTFDRLAREGVLFSRAFCASPSCTPSRGAILTGQEIWRLGEGGNLWSTLPRAYETFPDILERAGYVVGSTRKGWGPGNFKVSGRLHNPAGPPFRDFDAFMKQVPEDKPFCFWYGSQEPHRPYEPGSGRKLGMDPGKVSVPPFLPDTPEVREDILDYYKEVQDFDRQVAEILEIIEAAGRTANTLVVMTSDNGMPFPRAKANLYDSGTHLPLAICWPGRIAPGKRMDATFSFTDFAPTLLAAAGVKPVDDMTGKSWLPMLIGDANAPRERVYFGRERHANVRAGDLSYPARAVRTKDYLYIRNFRPDRWPAGDPEYYRVVGPFGDIDGSPTKTLLLERRDDPAIKPFFEMACAKRPAEELYDLKKDPWQLNNVADDKAYAETKARLGQGLESHLKRTGDPRVTEDSDAWDRHPYYGEMREWPPGAGNAQGQKRE